MSSTIGISPSGNFATKSSERVRGACPHTSQNLTDLGRGPVFYDCLVEVRAT
jgi:hypothetical protein